MNLPCEWDEIQWACLPVNLVVCFDVSRAVTSNLTALAKWKERCVALAPSHFWQIFVIRSCNR
jgi:hypothetical protein